MDTLNVYMSLAKSICDDRHKFVLISGEQDSPHKVVFESFRTYVEAVKKMFELEVEVWRNYMNDPIAWIRSCYSCHRHQKHLDIHMFAESGGICFSHKYMIYSDHAPHIASA